MSQELHVQRILAAESRAALLAALARAEHPLSVEEAAALLDLHPSTTRFHLDLLVSAGLVERSSERLSRAGRPRLRYAVRAAASRSGPPPAGAAPRAPERAAAEEGYRRLAGVLADQLDGMDDPASAAREAGRRWSAAGDPALGPAAEDATGAAHVQAAAGAVIGLMDRLGFAPEVPEEGDRILLRRCPFEAVARAHRAVVCGVHAGLLEEMLERLGGAASLAGLDPFVSDDPLLCVVRLRYGAPPDARSAGGRLTPGSAASHRARSASAARSG